LSNYLFTTSPSRLVAIKKRRRRGAKGALIPLKEFDFLLARSRLTPEGRGAGEEREGESIFEHEISQGKTLFHVIEIIASAIVVLSIIA